MYDIFYLMDHRYVLCILFTIYYFREYISVHVL